MASIAVLGACLFCLSFAGAAGAAWTPPVNVASESGSTDFDGVLPPVALSDGSSASSWLEYGSGDMTTLATRRIGRDGNPVGDRTVVATVAGPPGGYAWISDTAATESSSGKVLFGWVERSYQASSDPISGWAVKTRSIDPAGNAGPVNTVASGSLPSSAGSDTVQEISLDTGAGKTAISWAMREARGSDCGYYYASDDCVVKAVSKATMVGPDGAPTMGVLTLMDVLTECGYSSMESFLEVAPNGTATAVATYCRDQASDFGIAVSFRKFNSSGTVGERTLLTWVDSPPAISVGIDGSGQVSVSVNSRIFRIAADGTVAEPKIVGDSGQNDQPIQEIAVQPGGATTATWVSTQAGGIDGNGLDYTVWTRQLKGDGSLGERNAIKMTTVDRPAGGWIYFAFSPSIATGQGTATGTIGLTEFREAVYGPPGYNTQLGTGLMIGELNADGSLGQRQSAPGTNVYGGQVEVSADGTGVANWTSYGSDNRASLMSSKLPRDTSACGVIPSKCKAKLVVQRLKPGKGLIRAGKALKVKVTVKNAGDKDATAVKGTVKSGNRSVKVPKKVSFGKVAVGASVTRTIKVKANRKAKGKTRITVKVGSSSKSAGYRIKAGKKRG